MPHLPAGIARHCTFLLFLALTLLSSSFSFAQFETATVAGQVSDPSGLSVSGAQVNLVDIDRGATISAVSDRSGLYRFTSVRPGRYRIEVRATGFKVINFTGLTVNVQDHLEQNFRLSVGSVSESVTVEGGAPQVNTESPAVSTVVDRQFAENLPMNGRSFQTLIDLTPGVVLTPITYPDTGQFSVNGQRTDANYWMVDGVSANIGVGALSAATNGYGGGLGSFSAQGGTNSLVSVDALQEFRIQTSTYAPEFGRTPGGQISIVTRSGTNQFHGTAFNYLRNDILDANDWFASSKGLPKPEERQNDFGGTFSGPLLRDRTFFFFSYEGLRLRLPQTTLTTVPCDRTCAISGDARSAAIPAMQPFLRAYPMPNGTDHGDGTADFNASYSNSSTLDAYSLRIDHKLAQKLSLFARYNYSPSETIQRGFSLESLNSVSPAHLKTQTGTLGATWGISPLELDELRFNYSRVDGSSYSYLDGFGGATPFTSSPVPGSYTTGNANFVLGIVSLESGSLVTGKTVRNLQRQVNIVDNLSMQRGSHNIKFGVDFRRLSPVFNPPAYSQLAEFFDVVPCTFSCAEQGTLFFSIVAAQRDAELLFRNLGAFAQDTWRILSHLTLTYGLRWDVDFAPSTANGLNVLAVTGYNLNDLSKLALAPQGTPPFKTRYDNLAPRIGLAWQLSANQKWQRVLRGGFGVFYDLATQQVGGTFSRNFPFGIQNFSFGGTFPLANPNPLPFDPSSLSTGTLYAFDPNLRLPYTLEWNVALDQGLGEKQNLSLSYIGSRGRRLIQSSLVVSPNSNFGYADLVGNSATSDYGSLQAQFQRRLSHRLQALASYTWSHSIDTASAGSLGNAANGLTLSVNPNQNRGSSDFDVRNAFSAGLTYDVPTPRPGTLVNAILSGWSLQSAVQARSALPVNVYNSSLFAVNQSFTNIRPDVIPGVPLYLNGSQYPGRKAINDTPGAVAGGCPDGSQSIGPFCPPPTDANGNPLRQGDLGRNSLRGFGAAQWDFAVHRDFPILESLKLQFRAEIFNLLNHPNFGPPIGDLANPKFGLSDKMLGQSLSGGAVGDGGLSPLYQIGGPRSIQFALKLQF